jgi:Secretion system C-terminal sorting domain
MEVLNAVGQTVFEKVIVANSGENKFTVNSESLSKGVYIIKIFEGENILMKRLVIDK